MNFSKSKNMFIGVTGTALLLFGTGVAVASPMDAKLGVDKNSETTTHKVDSRVVTAKWLEEAEEESADYIKASNVVGEFAFNQEGVTPTDELFNVFGAAFTSMCSKPAVELTPEAEGVANYYINVGGHVKKSFSVDVSDLAKDASQETLMACSCATGAPFGQAAVMGVPLSAVVEMADLEEGVNTITAYGADGFGQPLPLRYALEKNALLVYQVNGQELKTAAPSSSLQLWMPETVARYFTRNIVDIELTHEDKIPSLQTTDPCYRNKINILNYSDGCAFKAGDKITFEGVADDLGSPIVAVEFSFDGGATWTSCETKDATLDKWVNWQFETSFKEKGDYRMTTRSKTADGMVSPLEATLFFEVV